MRAFLLELQQEGGALEAIIALVTPEAVSRYLYAPDLSNPDLIIRTSGEIPALRLSALVERPQRVLFH